MATKIRMQRFGRKNHPYYHIVIADSRAPRDGRFTERIGSYNPNTNPATIDLNFERALYWINTGATPTDTVRNILSEEGVMMMKHLQGGVAKGAFTEEDAKTRFEAWKSSKNSKIEAIATKNVASKEAEKAARLAAEKAVYEAKAEVIAKKKAEERAQKEAVAKAKAEAEAAKLAAEAAPAEEALEAVAEEEAPEAE